MFRKARAGRECKKCVLDSEIFCILSFPTIFSSPFRSQFLSFPFHRPRLTLAATLSPSCVFNPPPHPPLTATRWLSSLFDFWHSCHACISRAALFSFFPSSLDSGALSPAPTMPPQTWIQFSTSHPAKVTPRRGRKQCDAQLLERRNGETFLSSLCFYPPLSPFFLLPRATRSKTISEHIAPRFSRSALRTRPTAMSSRLFDPRGRRNNAYTTTVAVFPLLVSLVFVLRRPCTVVARFSTRKKSLGKKSLRSKLAN